MLRSIVTDVRRLRRCDSSLQRDLGMMSYFQLIVDPRGRDLAKRLVTNVVNQQISQDMSVSPLPRAEVVALTERYFYFV